MANWTLITGASEGLGVEFAKIAAARGRNLILSARSKDKLDALAQTLRAEGREVVVITADLNDLAEAERLWAEATDGRTIDFVVNNAGLGRSGGFHADTSLDGGWARELSSINVNILSLTRLMKLAISHMQQSGGSGRILNVASVAGFLPGPNMAVYGASKAFVLHLSEAVAFELRNTRITVTALCPGPTKTRFFDSANMQGQRLLKLARMADAKDVAMVGWQGALGGRRVVVPGLLNILFALFPRLSPRGFVLWATNIFLSKK